MVNGTADLGHASNLEIENTTGSYLSFVDVDDWIEPEYIKNCMAVKKDIRVARIIALFMMVLKTCRHTKEGIRMRYPSIEIPSYYHVEKFQFTTHHYLRN